MNLRKIFISVMLLGLFLIVGCGNSEPTFYSKTFVFDKIVVDYSVDDEFILENLSRIQQEYDIQSSVITTVKNEINSYYARYYADYSDYSIVFGQNDIVNVTLKGETKTYYWEDPATVANFATLCANVDYSTSPYDIYLAANDGVVSVDLSIVNSDHTMYDIEAKVGDDVLGIIMIIFKEA